MAKKAVPKKKTSSRPKKERRPLRQELFMHEMMANGGSVKQAMIKVGYSPAYAKNSQKLVATKSFGQLRAEKLPLNMVMDVAADNMTAMKMHYASFPKSTDPEEAMEVIRDAGFNPYSHYVSMGQLHVVYFGPDYLIRDKAVDKAFKVHGVYSETMVHDATDKYRQMSGEEIAQRKRELIRKFKKQ